MLLGVYQFLYSFKLVRDGFASATDAGLMDYVTALASTLGFALQTIAVALLCMFAARICKLEGDPEFKKDIAKLVKRLRYAGDKTEINIGKAQTDVRDGK
jgi:hypothetical protein